MGELDSLRKEFAALDVDGDGFVTCGDLTALLAHLELAGAPLRGAALEVEAIVEACDLEDDHRISYHALDRVDKMFHEFLDGVDAAGTETITAESLQSHGFDAEVVADVAPPKHKPRDDAPYYYRPKPVSLTAGHFALSVRLTQIRSCEEKIEAAVNAGAAPADVEALEKRYLEVIVLGRNDHRVEAIKLRAQGQMAAALDAFREAKHLDFILRHRADFVANRGPLPEKRVVAETLSQAHARLAAMSDP
ncbi:serine/threonine kinase [Aureococcus anophagefferens]|nr:serine/threonine kinase [Aureococcus anophagefferens]